MIAKRGANYSIESFVTGALFPVIGLVYALKQPTYKGMRTLIVMFFVFIGLCTLYEDSPGLDTNRIVEQFLLGCNLGDVSLWSFYKMQPESNQVDVYLTVLSWFCSRFISNPHLYLGIVVGLMGLALTSNLNFVLKRYYTSGIGQLLFILLLFVPQAVYYPHRWWMAMQIFLLGALPLVYDKSYKRFYFCFLAVLVHFSYIYLLAILIGYIFLPKKNVLPYIVIFYISLFMLMFVSNFNFATFIPYLEESSDAQFIGRTTMYMQELEADNNFLYKSAKLFFNIAKGILFLLIYFQRDWVHKNRNIFCWTLLFTSFAQFASLNPVGYRFVDFGNFIVVIFYIYFFSTNNSYTVKKWFTYLSPVFVYYIIYQIRGILGCISLQQLFMGNCITIWFLDDNISVLNLIKNL